MLSVQASGQGSDIAGVNVTIPLTVTTPTEQGDVYIVFTCQAKAFGGGGVTAKWDGSRVNTYSDSLEAADNSVCGNTNKLSTYGYVKVPVADYDSSKDLKFEWGSNDAHIHGYAIIEGVLTVEELTAYVDSTSTVSMPYTETPTLLAGQWAIGVVNYPYETNGLVATSPNELWARRYDAMNSSTVAGYCEIGETLSFDVSDANEYVAYISWKFTPAGQAAVNFFGGNF